jgi:glycosyltransferase involved in cell wall biosynthesis
VEKSENIDLSLIIACYQEGEHLDKSFESLIATLKTFTLSYEIIFIEDCSKDNTKQIIESIRSDERYQELKITYVFHEENKGRGQTVTDGISLAKGRVAGFIDIDLEVSPVYIAACVQPILNDESDMVLGHRHYNVSIFKIHRYFLTVGYQFLIKKYLKIPPLDTESGYKFFDREKFLVVLEKCEDAGWFWDTETVVYALDLGLRVSEIDCLFKKRDDKTSTVNMLQDSWVHYVKLKELSKKRKR